MLLGDRGLLNWMPDKPFLKLIYRENMGRKLHLNPPVTFTEKLNWLKLYDRRELYTQISDKLGVREYIKEKVGSEYLVPLLGVWDDPEKIDFAALPDRFVLKATHDSGSVMVCRNKDAFDQKKAIQFFKRALKNRFYMKGRERQYEHIVPRIAAEEYLDDGTGNLPMDYKLLCFDGRVKCLYVVTGRGKEPEPHMTFFDREWNRLPIVMLSSPPDPQEICRPEGLERMVLLTEKLCADMPIMRADFYEIFGNTYIGELTLYVDSGLEILEPPEWERTLGEWIVLPEETAPAKG